MKMCGVNDMNDLMYDIWPQPDVGLPTYPLGIRLNVALAEPHTSMYTPQQGLLKGFNGVRLKVNEKRIKAQDPKYNPPGCASSCIGISVSLRFSHSSSFELVFELGFVLDSV